MDPTLAYYYNVNEFLKTSNGIKLSPYSCVYANVNAISQFINYSDVELPFLINGRLITAGEYKEKGYGPVFLPKETLQSAMNDWVDIFIYKSHATFEKIMRGEDVSVDDVVGKITKVEWNEKDSGIDFYAEVFDKQIAYKMANGLIKFISVGFGREIVRDNNRFIFMNMAPKETSLVFDPRDKKAEFKPAKE